MPPHTSTESSRLMAPKLRRALPMFNFEHRFESLTPSSPWITAAREATRAATPATEPRPESQRRAETVQGHVVIVTGGATGLGRATALEFAQRGVAVGVNYVDLPPRGVAPPAPPSQTPVPAPRAPGGLAPRDRGNHPPSQKVHKTRREGLG